MTWIHVRFAVHLGLNASGFFGKAIDSQLHGWVMICISKYTHALNEPDIALQQCNLNTMLDAFLVGPGLDMMQEIKYIGLN